tara:strand:- start:7536 stop:9071 length:1536 start_codon:yes stop_codon:yes gene_type:complete
MNIRSNWRIIALVILLMASVFLISPIGSGTSSNSDSLDLNLSYGLDLSGGTRLRAPIVGWTAEDVSFVGHQESTVEETILSQFPSLSRSDVDAKIGPNGIGTFEIFANIPSADFETSLDSANLSFGDIRPGVTPQTRQTTIEVLNKKFDESGLTGATVQQSTTPSGQNFIIIEVPNYSSSEVKKLVEKRGSVEIAVQFPIESGESKIAVVLTQKDIATVGTVQDPTVAISSPHVPVTLTEDGAYNFQTYLQQYGFSSQSNSNSCISSIPISSRYCIHTVLDGEIVHSASISSGLANTMEKGEFVNSKNFVMTSHNRTNADSLRLNLRAGALPAPLDLDSGTINFVSPSLAENFKIYSFLIGLTAILAVAIVVFIRYGDIKVALPMVVTALSEVIILLGFSSGIGLALDLSHIAGFIAVIGTGVDDLIIIADEVMAEGSVSSARIFQNRFRAAFWIIGAAAITTIVALSPLAVLSLGDLRGFAIVTILGVLIGVLVTRPAYGDILKFLLKLQ